MLIPDRHETTTESSVRIHFEYLIHIFSLPFRLASFVDQKRHRLPPERKKLPIHGNEQKDDGKKGEYNQWEKY